MKLRLGPKLVLAFLGLIVGLLGIILVSINKSTTTHEVERIQADLSRAAAAVEATMDKHQERTRVILDLTTRDPKWRSFLSLDDPGDNFVPFANEIAKEQKSAFVLIAAEDYADGSFLALSPSSPGARRLVMENVDQLPLARIIDEGEDVPSRMAILGGRLYLVVSWPLKRKFSDDYYAGCIVLGFVIDDGWAGNVNIGARGDTNVIFVAGRNVMGSTLEDPALGPGTAEAFSRFRGEGSGRVFGFELKGERYLGYFVSFPTEPASGYVVIASLDKALENFVKLQRKLLYLGLGVAAVALGVALFITRRIVKPVHALVGGTRAIREGNYSVRCEADAGDEIGELAGAFNDMAVGLAEKEYIKDTFGKYVSPAIVEDVLKNPEKLALGGERRVQTVFFSDVASFTSISESLDSQDLVRFLNDYLEAMTGEIVDRQGNVGSTRQRSFTVIGDTVNLGARLEGANKSYGTRIMCNRLCREQAGESFVFRELDAIAVKGKTHGERVFELVGLAGELPPEALDRVRRYEEALAAYRGKDWDAAQAILARLQQEQPADMATGVLLDRVNELKRRPPEKEWTGVYVMKTK